MVMQISPMPPEASSMDEWTALNALCAASAIRFERRGLLRAILALGEVVGQELTAQVTARELAREMECHPGTASRWMRELRELGLAWLTIDSSGRGYRVVLDLAGEAPFFCPDPDEGTIRMRSGCDPDVIPVQPGCDPDVIRMQPGCDPDAIGTDDATRAPASIASLHYVQRGLGLGLGQRACAHEDAEAEEVREEAMAEAEAFLPDEDVLLEEPHEELVDELAEEVLARVECDEPLAALRAARAMLEHTGGDLSEARAYLDGTLSRLARRHDVGAGLVIRSLRSAIDFATWQRSRALVDRAATTSPPPPPAPTRAEASRADREQAAREAMRARLGLPPATQGGEQ